MNKKLLLQNTKNLIGKELQATDGTIGHVKDFYFDDKTWMIRYLLVDTGNWLPGKQVLLSPRAFGEFDSTASSLRVDLSKRQIEESPSVEEHLPISRKYENDYHAYYGWPPYWEAGGMMGIGLFPITAPPMDETLHHQETEAHLQSLLSVQGYHIKATDGSLGHLVGFMIGGRDWQIHEIVMETGIWHIGKEIHFSPAEVKSISYGDSTISVSLEKTELLAVEVK